MLIRDREQEKGSRRRKWSHCRYDYTPARRTDRGAGLLLAGHRDGEANGQAVGRHCRLLFSEVCLGNVRQTDRQTVLRRMQNGGSSVISAVTWGS